MIYNIGLIFSDILFEVVWNLDKTFSDDITS